MTTDRMPLELDLVMCSCGLAKYAIHTETVGWVFVCEDCDLPPRDANKSDERRSA